MKHLILKIVYTHPDESNYQLSVLLARKALEKYMEGTGFEIVEVEELKPKVGGGFKV